MCRLEDASRRKFCHSVLFLTLLILVIETRRSILLFLKGSSLCDCWKITSNSAVFHMTLLPHHSGVDWHPSCVVRPRSPRLVRGSDNMEHFHRRLPAAIFCQPPSATCHSMIILCNMFTGQTYIVLPSSKIAHTKDTVTSHTGLCLSVSQQSLSCSSLTHTRRPARRRQSHLARILTPQTSL